MVRYAEFGSFYWLPLVPALAALLVYRLWQESRAWRAFSGSTLRGRVAGEASTLRKGIKASMMLLASLLIIIALAQPQWGKHWTSQQASGRDIIVAIDVSRSMLAEDVTPNRLERAKADVRDLVAAVEESGGHRLGLLAFAGSPSLKCPLTQVYSHFKLVLDTLKPQSVTPGGTMIGDSIRQAIEAFDEKTQHFRDIILITDGEDMGSFPLEAAAAARDAGVAIYTVGLGDVEQGARIPVTDQSGRRSYYEHQGEIVWTKLDDRTLRQVAEITGGIYIPAGTRAIELDRIFRDVIEPKTKRAMDETRRERLRHRFQWFLAPAILLLVIESLTRVNVRRAASAPLSGGVASREVTAAHPHRRPTGRQSVLPAAGAFVAMVVAGGGARAEDARSLVRQGNRLYEQGKYAEAAELFGRATALAPESCVPTFNRAAALFQAGDFSAAAKAYEQARLAAPREMYPQISYALGNCHLHQARAMQARPDVASQTAKTAIQHFREAIASASRQSKTNDVSDSARHNLELAKRLIQQPQQQPPQQSENGQGQDQNRQDEQKQTDQGQEQGQPNEPQKQPESDSQQRPEQGGEQPESEQDPPQQRGSASEQLTPEEAADRLRAAVARAQMARARRLNQQTKQGRVKAVEKDW